jgi:hypothetical protein
VPRHLITLWISGDLSVQHAGQLRLKKARAARRRPHKDKIASDLVFSLAEGVKRFRRRR